MIKILFGLFIISLSFGLPTKNYVWKPLRTGAGGWVTGLHFHSSGNPFYVRTDVAGAYRFIESTQSWKQLVTVNSVGFGYAFSYEGVLSIVSAPTNPNRAYMAYLNKVFISNNQGDTWTETNLQGTTFSANAEYRFQGERLAVSPINQDIVYFGSLEGLRWSNDAGNTWNYLNLSSFGVSEQYPVGCVEFISQNIIYFTVDKVGIFGTTNGGNSWNLLNGANGPTPNTTNYAHITVDKNGVLYVASNRVWKYSQGTWTDLNCPRSSAAIAVHPNNTLLIVSLDSAGGAPYVSINGGATWTTPNTIRRIATDIPWLAWTDETWMSVGNIGYHPIRTNELWFSQGIGVWKNLNQTGNPWDWISVSKDIEELVGTDLLSLPGGRVVTASWDRAIFYHENLDVYPSTHAPTSRFNSGWDLDSSPNSPNFVVAVVSDHRFCCGWDGLDIQSGYSTDYGKTWMRFSSLINGTHPSDLWFGNIAVAARDTNNIIWLPTFNAPPYYTLDRGASWNLIRLPDLQGTSNGSHFAFYLNRRVLTADRVQDRTFYLYHTDRGIYRSQDGGVTWTLRNSTGLLLGWPAGYYNVIMESVPGHSGHLFWAPGTHSVDYGFYRSQDGGDNWTRCPGANLVHSFGFGKPLNVGEYPVIYVQGTVNGTKGMFFSEDQCNTWTAINPAFPLGIFAVTHSISGDLERYGRVYVNFGNSGPAYGDIAGATTGIASITSGSESENSSSTLQINFFFLLLIVFFVLF